MVDYGAASAEMLEWNAEQRQSFRIDTLISLATDAKIRGDYKEQLIHWKTIRDEFNSNLNPTEKKIVNEKEEAAENDVEDFYKENKFEKNNRYIIRGKPVDALRNYEWFIRDMLKKHGFVFRTKGDPGLAIIGGRK